METIIDVRDTSIPDGVASLVEQLPISANLGEKDMTIIFKFPGVYVYQTGLVLLATWRKTLPNHIKVRIDDTLCQEATKRLLTNSGFRELMEGNVEIPSKIHYHPGKVPLQPILRGYNTEKAISSIVDIFNDYAKEWIDMKAFGVLLSELCENSFVHSNFETPGYIAANLHENTGKCEIAIADSGIGVLNSYLEGTNEEAKQRIQSGACAIELAVDGLSSSKPTPMPGTFPSYYGFGLFIVRRLIEENLGRLTIISGKDWVNFEKYQKNRGSISRPWNGTFVGILINIENPLPLAEIYDEGSNFLVASDKFESAKQPPAKQKKVDLAQYGTRLLTREIGAPIRADIATILASGARVEVDLSGIEDLTPSVADEVFGKLAESLGKERFEQVITFVGGNPLLPRLINFVISTRLSKPIETDSA